MRAIKPTYGTRAEYAPLHCEMVEGCAVGCRYCMHAARAVAEGRAASVEAWHSMPVEIGEAWDALERDAHRIANSRELFSPPAGPVLLGPCPDPFQRGKVVSTELVIETLLAAGAGLVVLSRNDLSAVGALDLLAAYPERNWAGQVFTCWDEKSAEFWEQGGAAINDRLNSLARARGKGLATMAVLDPVIYPGRTKEILAALGAVADHISLGPLRTDLQSLPGLTKKLKQGLGEGLPGIRQEVEDTLAGMGYSRLGPGSIPRNTKTYRFQSAV